MGYCDCKMKHMLDVGRGCGGRRAGWGICVLNDGGEREKRRID